ncbi:hypothetical protein KFZ58_05505 [Virgibacillus sp. NKC19-16]|uniref:hypothetical protein n=1 Tax=Virgibacillus salidurans TaxID=2831673 RepID=UPI001F2FF811|nr:hypothetical protein [Virgibacillus sp. NKC19-16]UJL47349.1 hypothetical protein KFZ58_05505 [Virgibacillus sp. NKC19-16]
MALFAVILIVVLAVIVDVFWLDIYRKRWGWMKNWSNLNKALFFSGFIIVSGLIYFGLS